MSVGAAISAATLDRLLRLQASIVEQTEILRQEQATFAASAASAAATAATAALASLQAELEADIATAVSGGIATVRGGASVAADTLSKIATTLASLRAELTTHEADRGNPHAVTAVQIGLGSVANLAPADLPISTATATALSTLSASLAANKASIDTILGGANSAVDTFVEVYQRFLADESAAAALTASLSALQTALTNEIARATAAETANSTAITNEATRAKAAEATLAPLASPTLTGTPTAPTAAAGDNSKALATTEFVTRAAGASGAVLYNADQGLPGASKLRGKKNLSVEIGRRYYTGQPNNTATLTQADIGSLVYLEGDITSVQVPLAANYTDGDYFWIYCRGTATIQATAGDPYTFGFADANRPSFVMRPGDRCKISLGADAWDVASYTTRHDKALMVDRAQTFSDAELIQLLSNGGLNAGHGQCRLEYVSGTEVRLKRCNGNKLLINGRHYTMSDDLSISNSGLSASTAYYIYAAWNGSVLTAFAQPYAPVVDPTSGMLVSSAYSFHLYVGKFYVDSDGQFKDTQSKRYVLTHFNKRLRTLRGATGTYSTSSTSSVELSTAARASLIVDVTGQSFMISIEGTGGAGGTSPGYSLAAAPSLNGVDYGPPATAGQAAYGDCTGTNLDYVEAGDGLHYVTIKGNTSGNYSASFRGGVGGMVMM